MPVVTNPQPAPPSPPAPQPVSALPVTQEQFLSIIRWILATIGPFLIAHGYTTDAVWQQVIGVIIGLAPLIWSMIVKTRSGIISTAAGLPEVQKIVATPEIANGTLRAD